MAAAEPKAGTNTAGFIYNFYVFKGEERRNLPAAVEFHDYRRCEEGMRGFSRRSVSPLGRCPGTAKGGFLVRGGFLWHVFIVPDDEAVGNHFMLGRTGKKQEETQEVKVEVTTGRQNLYCRNVFPKKLGH